MSKEQKKYYLVSLGEESQLKIDLNKGVASLQEAAEGHFQSRLCLNGREGVEVIKKISQDPERADTEFHIGEHLIRSGSDIWLNISFGIFLDKICVPTNVANLSPRQTSYIVRGLPVESQKIVLEKVKAWYSGTFLEEIRKGIETITEQFNKGDPLIESDNGNRIFDIHGGRSMDVPYTEWYIVGENLFPPFFFGFTLFEHEQDGYRRIDNFLANVDNQRKSAVNGMLELIKMVR